MNAPSEDTFVYTPAAQFADSFFSQTDHGLAFEFGSATHVGLHRSQNEDHFAVLRRRRSCEVVQSSLAPEDLMDSGASSYLMVVVDGMGGMKSGELASRLALQAMVELSSQATSWVMKFTDTEAQQLEQRIAAYAQRIHSMLHEQGVSDPEKENMGTTWTSAHLYGSQSVIVHIGDSRAYRYRDGELRQVTTDDTMAQALIESGMPPASVSRFSHVLINSLGGGNDCVSAAIHELNNEAGDRILLCSDGLTDMVSDEEIAITLSQHTSSQSACDALIAQALENGGKDNVTVVLASVVQETPHAA